MTTHTSHPEIVKRLKRAEGHIRSIITMLEGGRNCLDIAQQLQAVESAVANAKKTLVHDHIDHCLERAVRSDPRMRTKPSASSKPSPSICKGSR